MKSLLFGALSDAFTHVCIDIGIACFLFSLSLSSQHILHGELSDPRLTKQALIRSSGAGYYWYHLPAYHAKIPAALSTSANEHDGVRASVIQERQTQHTFENIATLDGLDNMRSEIPYKRTHLRPKLFNYLSCEVMP